MAEQTNPHIEISTETLSQNDAASVQHQIQNPNSQSYQPPPPSCDCNALLRHRDPDDASFNPQNPSKIPIRPQKMRKLSNPTSDDKMGSSQTGGFDSPVVGSSSSSPSSSLALTAITTAVAVTPGVTPPSARNRRRSSTIGSKVARHVIRPLSAQGEIDIALNHLRVADPVLGSLIDAYPLPQFENHSSPFISLAKSIIYQQLALKAGTSIYTRFTALCGGEELVSPDTVLALSSQQLKQVGVSGRKASYLYDLANKYKSGILSDDVIVKMDDKSLFTMLSMVKGIGSWSVHMFMIFSLQRPDVLPVSDLGVRKGVQLLYGLDELPRPSQMEQLCEKWRPYRSVASWYLWRIVEGKESSSPGNNAVSLVGGVVQPLQQIESQQGEHQHQLQFVEGIGNMGSSCIWNH